MIICSAAQSTLTEFSLLMVRCSIISIIKNLFEGAETTNDQNRPEHNFKHLEHSTDTAGLFLKNLKSRIKILVIDDIF